MFTRLYLHIPFCACKCPYCAFVSQTADRADIDGYPDLLLKEMQLAVQELSSPPKFDSIYFGGGTPSLLHPRQIALIIDQIASLFKISNQTEITLEANPGTVNQQQLASFRKAGINRLSLGVQSFDDRMLALLGRIHTAKEALSAFNAARAAGFDNIGLDLIHTLPGQNLGMWQNELEKALLLAPEHLSIYGLTIEEETPFAKKYPDSGKAADEDELAAEMFEKADDLLTQGGYEHYEIANYTRPGHRSRHNSGYWQRDGYLGLGVGAHSFLRDVGQGGSQGIDQGTRFSNITDLKTYAAALWYGSLPRYDINHLSRQDAMEEFMFLGLRMADGISFDKFYEEFGVSLTTLFKIAIEQLSNAGLIITDDSRMRLTRRGMLLSNQVFSRFLL